MSLNGTFVHNSDLKDIRLAHTCSTLSYVAFGVLDAIHKVSFCSKGP